MGAKAKDGGGGGGWPPSQACRVRAARGQPWNSGSWRSRHIPRANAARPPSGGCIRSCVAAQRPGDQIGQPSNPPPRMLPSTGDVSSWAAGRPTLPPPLRGLYINDAGSSGDGRASHVVCFPCGWLAHWPVVLAWPAGNGFAGASTYTAAHRVISPLSAYRPQHPQVRVSSCQLRWRGEGGWHGAG